MSDISLQLAREFFELAQFQVLTAWRADEDARDSSPLLLVQNTLPFADVDDPPPFLLTGEDAPQLSRAIVDVRAWHADRFYPSVIENNPVLHTVALPRAHELATRHFGEFPFRTLLIISELPQNPEPRRRSLELLAQTGLHHVMEFGSLLQSLLRRVSPAAGYASSPTLQTARLLKRYGFITNQQLEFEFPGRKP
ncbi:MAG: hypothetical protein RLZZ303_423 [Candidatus Hydrogenedentota bacterium]|jgi:hypothetical protein